MFLKSNAELDYVRNRVGLQLEALKEAGYHPIPLPVTEIHTGRQSGLIEAFTAPPVMSLKRT